MTTSTNDQAEFKAAVEEACARFAANFARRDAEALVQDYYAPAPLMLAPDQPLQKGKDALKAVFASMWASGVTNAHLAPVELSCSGDVGYEIGNASLTAAGAADPLALRYLVVWRRVDGAWKAEVDMFTAGKV